MSGCIERKVSLVSRMSDDQSPEVDSRTILSSRASGCSVTIEAIAKLAKSASISIPHILFVIDPPLMGNISILRYDIYIYWRYMDSLDIGPDINFTLGKYLSRFCLCDVIYMLKLDEDKCLLCGGCAAVCPADALMVLSSRFYASRRGSSAGAGLPSPSSSARQAAPSRSSY